MWKKTSLLAFFMSVTTASASFADNYKWVSIDGTKVFTDNFYHVPKNLLKQSAFEFDALPPVKNLPPAPTSDLDNLSSISSKVVQDKDPFLRLSLDKSIRYFEKKKGLYSEMLNWPPSIMKYRVLRRAVLKTTPVKQALLIELGNPMDSVALVLVSAYLKTSIKNDALTKKWNNFGNRFQQFEVDVIDSNTGNPVVDSETNATVTKIVKTKKASGNGMTRKLSRRLLAEEAQKRIILIALKTELRALEKR